MTLYAMDLDEVQKTVRQTLVEKVLPAVESESARGELQAVIEMLDNLNRRLSWDAAEVSASVARTRELTIALGAQPDGSGDGLAALRAERRIVGERLAAAYADDIDPAVVRAVAAFSTEDIADEISRGLLPGLPG